MFFFVLGCPIVSPTTLLLFNSIQIQLRANFIFIKIFHICTPPTTETSQVYFDEPPRPETRTYAIILKWITSIMTWARRHISCCCCCWYHNLNFSFSQELADSRDFKGREVRVTKLSCSQFLATCLGWGSEGGGERAGKWRKKEEAAA